jgi:hypothetical protein
VWGKKDRLTEKERHKERKKKKKKERGRAVSRKESMD